MADATVTAANVRPLTGAKMRRYTTGGTVNAGDGGYLDSSGNIQAAKADAVGTGAPHGIVVASQTLATQYASGDRVDLVTYGPVTGFSGLTPGGVVYVSDANAGKLTQTKPTTTGSVVMVMGRAESATTIFVNPTCALPVAL